MAQKIKLKRSIHKDHVYGTLLELSRNPRIWRESSINPDYSNFTDEGKEAILDIMGDLFRSIQKMREEELREEAKQQTLDALKG